MDRANENLASTPTTQGALSAGESVAGQNDQRIVEKRGVVTRSLALGARKSPRFVRRHWLDRPKSRRDGHKD
jgi:hypothetical protein